MARDPVRSKSRPPQPVLVSSRTYNQSPEGTFGQYLDGVDDGDTVGAGTRVWLPQLQQNEDFRTNIGVNNTGGDPGSGQGASPRCGRSAVVDDAANISVQVRRIQLQEPFDRIAGRTDITSGYAVVEILDGAGVTAYASVVDNRTNDPTTVPMVR